MLTWTNNIGNEQVFADVEVNSHEVQEVANMLANGHIVAINKQGGFIFCTPFERRAIRWASKGDSIIWPDGRVFTCADSCEL